MPKPPDREPPRPAPPTSPAGGAAPACDEPGPAEIRRRVELYLRTPCLTAAERDAALDFLAAHPEVATARVARLSGDDERAGRFAPDPAEVLALADEVLVEFEATGYLRATLPEGEVRLRDLVARLAREVRRLLGRR